MLLRMSGLVVRLMTVLFLLADSDFLISSLPGLLLVDAFAGGGGFGASKRASASNSKTHQNKTQSKKPKKGRLVADVFQPSRTKEDKKSNQTPLDKWGLPPPTIEDIFPPMPSGTELVPVESSRDYSLAEIQHALQNHIPLSKLDLRFDEYGVERMTAASDKLTNDDDELQKPMKLRLLHQSPPVLAIDHFFTPEECLETYQVAIPSIDLPQNTKNTATLAHNKAPVEVQSKTFSALAQSRRTSTSWFCYYESVPTLLAKTRDVLGIALHQMEEPQIVRYRSGQEFSWHYDQVPPPQLDNGGQRLATLLVYLNTVPEGCGGGTVFRDLRDAMGHALTVQPLQGTALLFFPAFGDGRPDDRTLHQGEPIATSGSTNNDVEKRIVQMWIHEGSYRAAVPPRNRQEDAVAAVDQVSQRLGYHI